MKIAVAAAALLTLTAGCATSPQPWTPIYLPPPPQQEVYQMPTRRNTAQPLEPLTATARWTGRVQSVSTVTNQRGVLCEYRYLATVFTRTFVASSCPPEVPVQ